MITLEIIMHLNQAIYSNPMKYFDKMRMAIAMAVPQYSKYKFADDGTLVWKDEDELPEKAICVDPFTRMDGHIKCDLLWMELYGQGGAKALDVCGTYIKATGELQCNDYPEIVEAFNSL
jgi:hypothetical protein